MTSATQTNPECLPTSEPTITLESITFSDGTTISLESNDVVVFVGPNNAGKSVALRELERHVSGSPGKPIVVTSAEFLRSGTADELLEYLRRHARETTDGANRIYNGYRVSIPAQQIASFWSGRLRALGEFFCMRLATETRITDSDPAQAFRSLEDPVSHPIHMLYTDEMLECRISDYFRRAFGCDLVVYRTGGSEFPLLVGNRVTPGDGEDRISASYCRRLMESTVPLKDQGDGMRSFASVILHLLAPITPSILMLDEPEAFLHPPQAQLLGELIAKQRSARSQLFVATHSPDVLNGLLNVAPDHLRVLRIQRDGDVNRVKELDKQRVKELVADPLVRYSSVMSGVFHKRVIICESDSDCTFYRALLDLPEIHGELQPDVLFVHANGKHRIARLAMALTELGVPTDVIGDVDILRDDVVEDIVKGLAGDRDAIVAAARAVRLAVEEQKPWLKSAEVVREVQSVLESVKTDREFPKSARQRILAVFKKASPWDAVKGAGRAAIPSGQPTEQFQRLEGLCKETGLWIVPVGETEGFCRSVGGHGARWVSEVLEKRNLLEDPELREARGFVREMWRRRDNGGV